MTTVIYRLAEGAEHAIEVTDGTSLMEASVAHNLPGIVAECGGSCACATCHVHVDPGCADVFETASAEERDLLEFTDGVGPTSRLSCQLIVREEFPTITVSVPDTNG